jgi:hypothetical protein
MNKLKTYYLKHIASEIALKSQKDDPDWNYSIKMEKHRGMELWIVLVEDEDNNFLGYL